MRFSSSGRVTLYLPSQPQQPYLTFSDEASTIRGTSHLVNPKHRRRMIRSLAIPSESQIRLILLPAISVQSMGVSEIGMGRERVLCAGGDDGCERRFLVRRVFEKHSLGRRMKRDPRRTGERSAPCRRKPGREVRHQRTIARGACRQRAEQRRLA